MLFNEDWPLNKMLAGKEEKQETFRLRVLSNFQPI